MNLFENSITSTTIKDVNVEITQKTSYPRNGRVQIIVQAEKEVDFGLLIRKPSWCQKFSLTIDGEKQKLNMQNGYIVINRKWSNKTYQIDLDMEMTSRFIEATIEREGRVAVKYGPLMLVIDSRYGTPVDATEIQWDEKPQLQKLSIAEDAWLPQVKFKINGKVNGQNKMIPLVDYASAGSLCPCEDKFRLWIPVYEK